MTNLNYFMLPTLVGAAPAMAEIMRMTRSMMLEVLRQDYIRTAWAKGFKERAVIIRHALKNAMIPVITLIGFMIPYQLGQLVVVERVFNVPGIGSLLIQGIDRRDLPLIQGVALFFGVIVIISNLIVDLMYGWLDPRIHYK
jgi:peptide/nickel transport system permease protein